MKEFRVSRLQNSSVQYLYSIRDEIQMDPDYQRAGDVWDLAKRQLLIDSVINQFDIPKLYFRDFFPSSEEIDGRVVKYAIIDGKQRLEALWGFLDGKFPLSDDFEYLENLSAPAAGLTYSELAQRQPRLAALFTSRSLDIVTIQFKDVELVEEMFSRLNEAVPLNAAEKRNAFGGPLPQVIKSLAKAAFFIKKLPFSNRRYRHYDLSAKFLYFEYEGGPVDTKKAYLDQFVRGHRDESIESFKELEKTCRHRLRALDRIFGDSDPLLRSVGMVALYYLVAQHAQEQGWIEELSRGTLLEFNERRATNRRIAEESITEANYELLEFDRYAQSPNDSVALNFRLMVFLKHLGHPL